MSEVATKQPKPKSVVIPPNVERYAEAGDVILWYPSADPTSEPGTAIITKVELGGMVTANCYHPDLADTIPMDGCRHMDDPMVKDGRDVSAGGWRQKPLTVIQRRLALKNGWLVWEKGKLVSPKDGSLAPEAEPKA